MTARADLFDVPAIGLGEDLPRPSGADLAPTLSRFVVSIDILPRAWARAGAVRGRGARAVVMYTPADLRAYERDVHLAARQAWGDRAKIADFVPVTAIFDFHLPVPASWPKRDREAALAGRLTPTVKPDLLNLGKAIEDALQDVCYADDKIIATAILRKRYAAAPKVVIVLEW